MSVEHWFHDLLRIKIEKLCADHECPVGVAVGWIHVESGGRIDEITSLDERGYFQIGAAESIDLGLDHKRLSTDTDYSLACGFKLVEYHRTIVIGHRISNLDMGSELAWRLAKLSHSMGPSASRRVVRDAARHSAIDNWLMFSIWATERDAEYMKYLGESVAKWIGQNNRMFDVGKPYGVENLVCGPSGGGAA